MVDVPGKHFPQLTGAEQNASYAGTAVEFTERHMFARYMLKYAKGISAAPSSNPSLWPLEFGALGCLFSFFLSKCSSAKTS